MTIPLFPELTAVEQEFTVENIFKIYDKVRND